MTLDQFNLINSIETLYTSTKMVILVVDDNFYRLTDENGCVHHNNLCDDGLQLDNGSYLLDIETFVNDNDSTWLSLMTCLYDFAW